MASSGWRASNGWTGSGWSQGRHGRWSRDQGSHWQSGPEPADGRVRDTHPMYPEWPEDDEDDEDDSRSRSPVPVRQWQQRHRRPTGLTGPQGMFAEAARARGLRDRIFGRARLAEYGYLSNAQDNSLEMRVSPPESEILQVLDAIFVLLSNTSSSPALGQLAARLPSTPLALPGLAVPTPATQRALAASANTAVADAAAPSARRRRDPLAAPACHHD